MAIVYEEGIYVRTICQHYVSRFFYIPRGTILRCERIETGRRIYAVLRYQLDWMATLRTHRIQLSRNRIGPAGFKCISPLELLADCEQAGRL